MNITGTIHEIFPIQEIKGFTKREFILLDVSNLEYPQYIKFELYKDKADILDKLKVGDTVEVEFNIKGRSWTNPEGKVIYFNTLQAWKVKAEDDRVFTDVDNTPTNSERINNKPETLFNPPPPVEDDLPF
jgi:hypothetical protein